MIEFASCRFKRLSFRVESALIMEAEMAIAIASDNIEMHLKIKEVYQIRYLLQFLRQFQFVKSYFKQCLTACFVHCFWCLSCG